MGIPAVDIKRKVIPALLKKRSWNQPTLFRKTSIRLWDETPTDISQTPEFLPLNSSLLQSFTFPMEYEMSEAIVPVNLVPQVDICTQDGNTIIKFTQLCSKFPPTELLKFACDG